MYKDNKKWEHICNRPSLAKETKKLYHCHPVVFRGFLFKEKIYSLREGRATGNLAWCVILFMWGNIGRVRPDNFYFMYMRNHNCFEPINKQKLIFSRFWTNVRQVSILFCSVLVINFFLTLCILLCTALCLFL